ncbi:MAG: acetoin utilization protein AcuC [Deltaproteobacteria bacterium]|nr:acetoin utilization protein AcuC [Deltaproteobacteria bacterium]
MKTKSAFLYSEKFADAIYGNTHPMRPVRLAQTYELIKKHDLLNQTDSIEIAATKATEDDARLIHTPEYVSALKAVNDGTLDAMDEKDAARFSLGAGDNPVFKNIFEWSLYSTGASLQAAALIKNKEAQTAFNIAGGLHHAMAAKASGFCYLNDAAVAIKKLVNSGKRVLYVDIDAHHGDGVEKAFYSTDKVLTVSLHENGFYLFPGTGFPEDMGEGSGKGYSINLPFPPGTGDELFVYGFDEIVPDAVDAFKPDVLVTQLGVDTFASDPLTHLNLTTNGFEEMIRTFKSFDLPWIALGGGGYNLDNVKRAWTLAWAIMSGQESDKLDILRDAPLNSSASARDEKQVDTAINFLKKEVLPRIKGR